MALLRRIGAQMPNFLIACGVFLGGLVNIISVARPPILGRIHLALQIFPLNFILAARFTTLVAGLVLMVVSVNIYRGKRRAYLIALAFSLASVVLHLTKAIDYEEAITSSLLALILLVARKYFPVKSVELPSLAETALKIGLVVGVALLYGTLGFWFLDMKEFHVNFTWKDSLLQSLGQMTFFNTGVTPYTHHARQFLSSLHWLTVSVVLYASGMLFRPVLLRLRKDESTRQRARDIIKQYGVSSLDYFKHWPDKFFFFSPSGRSVIAYGVHKKIALVLGDPTGPAEDARETLQSFLAYCHENGWRAAWYQAVLDFLPHYEELGLKSVKIGDEAIVDLSNFTLEGRSKKEFRTTCNKLEKKNFTVRFLPVPLSQELLDALEKVSDDWLSLPGRRERTFTLGQFDRYYLAETQVVVVEDDAKNIVAFVNILPIYTKEEVIVDLMRFVKDAPNGTMDYLFVKLLLALQEQGVKRFSLGLAPMSGLYPKENSKTAERAITALFQGLNFIFRFKGIKSYKAKFADGWEPRYLVYESITDLPDIMRALAALSEISKSRKFLRLLYFGQ